MGRRGQSVLFYPEADKMISSIINGLQYIFVPL